MANVTLPSPVVALGGVICIAGGFLLGVVVTSQGPDTPTAEVVSYERSGNELCLQGDEVGELAPAGDDGIVCGRWMTDRDETEPAPGDAFRFVLHQTDEAPADRGGARDVLIYGYVVD